VGHPLGVRQLLLTELDQGFDALALGDLARHAQRTHVGAALIEERAGVDEEPHVGAVLANEGALDLGALASPPAFEVAGRLGLALLVQDVEQRERRHLLGRVAQDLGHLAVREGRGPVGVERPDAQVRRLDDAPVGHLGRIVRRLSPTAGSPLAHVGTARSD